MRARSRRRKARPDSGGSPSGAGLSVPCEPDSGSTSPLRLLERAALQMVEAEQPQRTQVPDFDTAIDIQRWVSNATDVVPSARKDIYLPTALKSSAFAAHVEALPDCDDVHQPRFPLTHAVLDPDGSDVAIVGSCDKTSQTHVVVAVSTEHKRQRRPDPLIFGVGLCPDYVQDLHWVPGSRQVVVAHNFQASVFTVSDRFAIDFQTSLTLAHTDEIREMAFCPSAPNLFASGGFDRILCAHDLNIGTRCTTASVRIDEIIGSVSWDRTDVHGVAITTDDGRFMMYDTRVKLRRPTMCVDSQKVQLYTHTWCNAHDVLLGFGDGTIQHTDLRTCRFLHDIRDPHVAAIDRLAVHGQSRTLLVSGYSDYTLWTLNNIDNRMSARSRGSLSARDSCTRAVFGRLPGDVICTNDLGFIGIHRHPAP